MTVFDLAYERMKRDVTKNIEGLLEKGLIEDTGKKRGGQIVYGITKEGRKRVEEMGLKNQHI